MKILVVDDHPIVRDGLRRLLSGEPGFVLIDAATARDGLRRFREEPVDLVIVDINLKGMGGLELIRRLRLEAKDARILVFSVHADPIYAAAAIRAGAGGYLSKEASPDEIIAAIRRVGRGGSYIEQPIAQELALIAVRRGDDPPSRLGRRDLDLLRLLASGASLGEIARDLGLSYKTVANNCAQIKAKLGVTRTADLIRLAIETGLGAAPPAPLAPEPEPEPAEDAVAASTEVRS
jgi:DNA-binding NarL/FixJ family response regulator